MTEYIDIVDENGEPTGDVIDRETAHSKGIRHRTAHVWLLRNNNDKVQILLQKRCQTKSSYPGCYDISSAGHIPSGVDYIQSALRELNEELGIIASPEELIYCGDRKIVSDKVFLEENFMTDRYQGYLFSGKILMRLICVCRLKKLKVYSGLIFMIVLKKSEITVFPIVL